MRFAIQNIYKQFQIHTNMVLQKCNRKIGPVFIMFRKREERFSVYKMGTLLLVNGVFLQFSLLPVFRIRIILMRIRIRGSVSGMMDPGPVLEQIPIFFFLIFSVSGLKLITMFLCCNFELIIPVY